jgi:hypothetical protein
LVPQKKFPLYAKNVRGGKGFLRGNIINSDPPCRMKRVSKYALCKNREILYALTSKTQGKLPTTKKTKVPIFNFKIPLHLKSKITNSKIASIQKIINVKQNEQKTTVYNCDYTSSEEQNF